MTAVGWDQTSWHLVGHFSYARCHYCLLAVLMQLLFGHVLWLRAVRYFRPALVRNEQVEVQ